VASYEERLTDKLSAESMQATLLRVGCVVAAYELLKVQVVSNVHQFFWTGFTERGETFDEDRYRRDVLDRDPQLSKYRASVAWLVSLDALTPDQAAILGELRTLRDLVTHELPRVLIDHDIEVSTDLAIASADCVRSLGVFWGSIEVDTDSYWDDKHVDYREIRSGSSLLMDHLLDVCKIARWATGD
jgi:hypothetical protein